MVQQNATRATTLSTLEQKKSMFKAKNTTSGPQWCWKLGAGSVSSQVDYISCCRQKLMMKTFWSYADHHVWTKAKNTIQCRLSSAGRNNQTRRLETARSWYVTLLLSLRVFCLSWLSIHEMYPITLIEDQGNEGFPAPYLFGIWFETDFVLPYF